MMLVSNQRTWAVDKTYIVLPDCNNIFLRHTSATNTFNIADRHVTHHLPSHVTNRAVSA